ncbi:uncharacterized protein si:ch211-86h15.1 isoform X2 [Megalobrama amblycephala]|uniref:uncharacterized protein si:ch211-86h15.1 isoform X2 n=1 Tax=Megalobrama amblycephala TaxID=75352 RepID=UPI002013F0A5|nr:uncharacterized protein si:ch211-86h15.1 isoform X2 [Megalobrama amblycephala]
MGSLWLSRLQGSSVLESFTPDLLSTYCQQKRRMAGQEIELLKRRLQQAGIQMDSETQSCSSETQAQKYTQAFSEAWRSEHDLKDTEMHMKLEVYTQQEENEVQIPVCNKSAPLSACLDIYHDQMPSKDTEPQMIDSCENTFPFINQAPRIKIEPETATETGITCQAQQHITRHGLDDSEASDASSDVSRIKVSHVGSPRHKTQTFNMPLRNQEMLTQHRMELAQIRERMSSRIQRRNSERNSKKSQLYVCQDEVSQSDKCKANNARNSQAWRDRLKKDPVKYAEYKALEAARAKEYRRKRTAAAKELDKENNRERQRRFRAKKKLQCRRTEEKECKAEEEPPPPKKIRKVLTRNERMKKREYDRIKKREERERMGEQKKRRIRERDASRKREKRRQKKTKKQTDTPQTNVGSPSTSTGFRTESTKQVAVSRMSKKIPADAEKFADMVMDFIHCCTPRKQAALKAGGLKTARRRIDFDDPSQEKLRSMIEALKKKKDTASLDKRCLIILKKYRMQRIVSRRFNLRPAYLTKLSKSSSNEGLHKKRKSDATCMDVVNNITAFYRNPKVARELPYTRTVKKQQQRFLMEISLQKAYELWKLENPEKNFVSFPVFSWLRPSCVLLQRRTDINHCLCEYCTGVLLKLQSLNRILTATNNDECMKLKIKNKYELIDFSLCPKSGNSKYHNLKCINRACSDCGVSLLKEKFKVVLDSYGKQEVSWQKWESNAFNGDGRQKTKKVQSTKCGTFKTMFDELLGETDLLAKHLFTANWQNDQFSLIREKLSNTCSLFVMDFAENYSCISHDEMQKCTQQITIHPIVCYYKCPTEGHDHTVQEALVFVSDDLNHDANAVHHFETLAIKHLKEKRGLKLEHVVEFTDGCGAQYKSKVSFADISNSKASHGLSVERCYFGSRHGKGPSNGVSGVVKSSVRHAVLLRRITINNAEEMYNFCNLNLTKDGCDGQLRTFFLVKQGEIQRDRPITQVKSALAGTRVLHSVRCVSPGVLDTRVYSCLCDGCMNVDDGNQCSNSKYVLPWQRRTLNIDADIVDLYQPVTEEENTLPSATSEDDQLPGEQIEDLWMKLNNPEIPTDDLVMNLFQEDKGQETSNEKPTEVQDLQIEVLKDYAVLYTCPPKWCLGRVLEPPTDGGVRMKFLEQHGVSNLFSWPKTPDVELVDPVYIFHGPVNLIGHHPFSVDEEEFKNINEKYKTIKKNAC